MTIMPDDRRVASAFRDSTKPHTAHFGDISISWLAMSGFLLDRWWLDAGQGATPRRGKSSLIPHAAADFRIT
jgi:hypothetical protein